GPHGPGIHLGGVGRGVLPPLLSALAPAVEASHTPPGVTVSQGTFIEAKQPPVGAWAVTGLALLVAATGIALWTVNQRHALGGFGSAILLLGGFSLLAPGFTLAGCRLLASPAATVGGVEAALAVGYLRAAVART